MTQIIQNPKSSNLTGQDAAAVFDLRLDANLLTKRLNALMTHISEIVGSDLAEGHTREISIHLKILKEIFAYNIALEAAQPDVVPKYTPEDKMAMAEQLADIVIRNGGTS